MTTPTSLYDRSQPEDWDDDDGPDLRVSWDSGRPPPTLQGVSLTGRVPAPSDLFRPHHCPVWLRFPIRWDDQRGSVVPGTLLLHRP